MAFPSSLNSISKKGTTYLEIIYNSYFNIFAIFRILLLTLFSLFIFAGQSHAGNKYASLVIDADTGVVLHQENAGEKRYPASLTKMMTLYLSFQAIERGRLRMNQRLLVSSRAASQPPSKLGLKRGAKISAKDAILSLIVKSANDSAVVLAEAVAGSEWQFAMMMNRMAKKLGMQSTNFINASGLHDRRQFSTAYDMARLSVALYRDFSKYYHYFNRTKFFYRGKVYNGHNRVVASYRGADGLKTGYTSASGFNLATSARRNGNRIVAIVLGGRTSRSRDKHMVSLLDGAFYKLAKGKVGEQRLYTGIIPSPQLKPTEAYRVAHLGVKPRLKPEEGIFASASAIAAAVKEGEPLPVPVLKSLASSVDAAGFIEKTSLAVVSRPSGFSAGEAENVRSPFTPSGDTNPAGASYASNYIEQYKAALKDNVVTAAAAMEISATDPFPIFKPARN